MNPVQRLRDDRLVILLFHGVVEHARRGVRNSSGKHIERERFIRILSEIKQAGQPLGMDEVIEHHVARRVFPPRAFAVTFDDGFENNHSVAAPILAEMNIPATFYVTTGFVENNAMSWIDRIERGLDVVEAGRVRLPWSATDCAFSRVEEKISLLNEIRHHAKRSRDLDLGALADDILAQCGVRDDPRHDVDPFDLKMSWEQVRSLADQEGFIIGGHSHTHATLSFLPPADLEWEIATSLGFLRQRAGIATRHYSYPEGLDFCYSEDVITALRRHGIVCSPTAEDGDNRLEDDLFRLKRISVV